MRLPSLIFLIKNIGELKGPQLVYENYLWPKHK